MRLRRPQPLDTLSPMSLFAAATLIIACCSAGVAGIPRQLSPEIDENPGGGPIFPFPVRNGETGEGRQQQTNPPEERNDDGKAMEDPGIEEDEEEPGMVPPYMLELYRRFSNDKHSHAMADIVRSFRNINRGATSVWTSDNYTLTVFRSLHFNITSISEDEDLQKAELRLRVSKKTLTILVYAVIAPPLSSPLSHLHPLPHPRFRLLASREVSPERSTWQTFPVTDALRRWTNEQTTRGRVFQVRIDTVVHRSNDEPEAASTGSDVSAADDDETILVVFSNDRKRRRELREIRTHENEAREKKEEEEGKRRRRKRRRWTNEHSSPTPRPEKEEEGEEVEESTSGKNSTAEESKWRLFKNQSGKRRRRRGRDSCRRKPMYVDFRDVKWENWIIEPSGYQAYECTGHCYFPIGPRLTPTKYAMVKSLLHATYPKRASATCCVPTRLEPTALLYKDEQGIVTYEYQYQDMVVAECGCR